MNEKSKLKIYTVRVYQGKPTYDEKGTLTSENHLVKLELNTKQFEVFLSNARSFYTKIEVIKATDGENEIEIDAEVKARIENCVKPIEKPLTPEQQKIKDLEEKLSQLTNSLNTKSAPIENVDNTELEVARLKYLEVFGEKPHHLWKVETLNNKIEEKLNS